MIRNPNEATGTPFVILKVPPLRKTIRTIFFKQQTATPATTYLQAATTYQAIGP
jgi:hypothetical protein